MTEEEKFKRYLRMLNEENSIDKKEEAMLGLLGLYYKQQTEIEELKEENAEQIEVITEWVNGERINDIKHISKDKIREKIKEYQNKLFQDIEENKVVEYENIIQVLEKILEE